jgi:hypothetical protein
MVRRPVQHSAPFTKEGLLAIEAERFWLFRQWQALVNSPFSAPYPLTPSKQHISLPAVPEPKPVP